MHAVSAQSNNFTAGLDIPDILHQHQRCTITLAITLAIIITPAAFDFADHANPSPDQSA